MAYVWILLISSLTVTNSFLLSNSSSPVRVTSPEFQHLSQLIFNEEQSRHHVENEVTSIELRVARLERDLRAKYDANLKQMEDMYNRKLLNLTDFQRKGKGYRHEIECNNRGFGTTESRNQEKSN